MTLVNYSHTLEKGDIKSKKMPNVKIVGISAAAAFVLSLISGIIGGVGFLTILLRAAAGAVVFGLLAGGIYVLLERMVPELFELEGEEEYEEQEVAQSGGNVDITLGEDEDAGAAQATTAGAATAEAGTESGEGHSISEASSSFEEAPEFAVAQDDESSDEDFIEELDESGAASDSGNSVDSEGTAGEQENQHRRQTVDADYGESTGVQGDGNEESSETKPSQPVSEEGADFGDEENVDVLPDLEDFADSFEGVAASQEGEGEMSSYSSGGGSSSSVDVMGDQHDSETVAKAVRTLMKKDQEG